MRENRPSGSEGGGAEINRLSLPLSVRGSLRDRERAFGTEVISSAFLSCLAARLGRAGNPRPFETGG